MSSALSIRQLTKTYGNGFQALKGIDLDVAEGDFFALLGPNGAGKSTTIGILSTLVNKTSGTVSVFGHDLDREPSALKRCLGVVPQEFNFNQFEKTFDIVVTQAGYYGIPPKLAKERAEQYLTQLGLWDKRDVQSRSLSGGMKRRLMIARALIHEPRLLILDEPTAGVDIELRRSMWSFLTELNQKGITIILTTHYLEEAEQLCRNIGIIDHGTIVENTSMRQLLGKLHVETFVLDLKQDLATAPVLQGYPCRLLTPHSLEVQVEKDIGITALFGQLALQNIEVQSLRNKTNRLEELFVSLVEKPVEGGRMSVELRTNWVALNTIVYREVRRFLRIWPQTLLPPAITMVLYFVIFGNLIGRQIGDMGGFTYMQYIVPGLIMMSVITNSYGNVVSSFFGSKFQRSIEELMVSPVSPHTILVGYVLGGVLRGLAVGVIVTILSMFFTDLQVHHLGVTVVVVLLTATIFSLLGFVNAVFARNFDDISIIPTFVLTPLTYLGGVFYSINLLPPFWQTVSLANPVLHMVNSFRYGILGVSDISIGTAITFMLVATAVLYVVCVRLLVSGRGMRA